MITTSSDIAAKERILEKELLDQILSCKEISLEKGKAVVHQDSCIRYLPFVKTGSLRVFRKTEDREISLYHVYPGETCALSLASCLERKPISVEVTAATNATAILIPYMKVLDWQKEFKSWNEFIIKAFTRKNSQVFEAFESLAFSTLHVRLKNHLLLLAEENNTSIIKVTHQELANEMGTTRVVISRILKNFEEASFLELHRGYLKMKQQNRKVS